MSRGGDDGGGDAKAFAGGGKSKPFAGVSFKLLGLTRNKERKLVSELERRGAVKSTFFGPGSGCTHVIVDPFTVPHDHDWCVKALKGNATVVNHMWLEHCICRDELLPTELTMYKPMVQGGVPGSLSLNICSLGYSTEEEDDIKVMALLMGASFHERWSQLITHVVCCRPEGPTYHQASESGTKIVSDTWLQDSLNSWQILPSDGYHVQHIRTATLTELRTPTKKSYSPSYERLTKSTGNKKPRMETHNSMKPERSRSLQFIGKRVTSAQYVKPDKRIVPVKYPFERIAKNMTEFLLKRVFLKKYGLLCHLHSIDLSLEGKLCIENFLISEASERVELYEVCTSPLTEDNRKADKTAFVDMVKNLFPNYMPADLRVWLKNIEEGWDDGLLLNHINMGDPESIFGQFLTMYYCLKKLEKYDRTKYNEFKEAMIKFSDWYEDGFRWKILEENKDYKDQRDLDLAKSQPGGYSTEKKVDSYRNNAHGALKTIKNTWSHPASALQDFFLPILLHEDEELLSTFQKAIFDSGYYGKNFSIKRF